MEGVVAGVEVFEEGFDDGGEFVEVEEALLC